MPKLSWKTIFIDFDGTLVDSMPILYSSYLRFLEKYGSSSETVIRLLAERYRLPFAVERTAQQFQELFLDQYLQKRLFFLCKKIF